MWLAPGLAAVREFVSADGSQRLAIVKRPDGLFCYVGQRLTTDDGDTYWEPNVESGIYESAEAAERAVIAELTWFRNEVPN